MLVIILATANLIMYKLYMILPLAPQLYTSRTNHFRPSRRDDRILSGATLSPAHGD